MLGQTLGPLSHRSDAAGIVDVSDLAADLAGAFVGPEAEK
jgi:hypothetical protein